MMIDAGMLRPDQRVQLNLRSVPRKSKNAQIHKYWNTKMIECSNIQILNFRSRLLLWAHPRLESGKLRWLNLKFFVNKYTNYTTTTTTTSQECKAAVTSLVGHGDISWVQSWRIYPCKKKIWPLGVKSLGGPTN